MNGQKKPCALCQEYNPLINSHLIPKFIYKLIRENQPYSDDKDKTPIIFNSKNKTIQKDVRQEKEFLLCKSCEELFQKKETIMSNIIRDIQKMPVSEKEDLFYKEDISNTFKNLNLYFSPKIVDDIKYFLISYIYRQYISTKFSGVIIDTMTASKMRDFLLNPQNTLELPIIIHVHKGKNHSLATSVRTVSSNGFRHLLFLIPEFHIHIILEDKTNSLSLNELVIIPIDFDESDEIKNQLKIDLKSARITKNAKSYIERYI